VKSSFSRQSKVNVYAEWQHRPTSLLIPTANAITAVLLHAPPVSVYVRDAYHHEGHHFHLILSSS
jgi:hypothetical protein